MESRADRPPKFAPYPMLVGTAITGQEASPPTTLANAPSMPRDGDDHLRARERIQAVQKAVQSGHAHVVDAFHATSQRFGGLSRLLGDGHITGARR